MQVCPYCEQDYVQPVAIAGLPGFFYMCPECDTVWTPCEAISDLTGQNYEDFMAERGRTADWSAVVAIKPGAGGE